MAHFLDPVRTRLSATTLDELLPMELELLCATETATPADLAPALRGHI